MTGHITPDQLDLFRNGRLSSSDVLALDDHLSACAECRAKAGSEDLSPWTILLNQGFASHPGPDELAEYLNGGQSSATGALIESHLQICAECRADVADLEAFRTEIRKQQTPTVVPFRRRPWYVAATGMAASLLLAAVLWQVSSRERRIPQKAEVPALSKPWQVALNDGGVRIGLDANGNFVGPAGLSASDQELLANSLRSGSLQLGARPGISSPAGTLRGSTAPANAFRVLNPVGDLVLSQHPDLNWEALPGASHYRVTIFSQDFDPVATSPNLTGTHWTVTSALPRGRTYSWEVSAVAAGHTILSPQPPQPEARFRVLEAARASQIEALLALPNPPHLLLAAKMAALGLRTEALAQLSALEQTNPNVPALEKLQQYLQSH